MKEQDFLNIIKSQIGSEYIGDDCAYLKDLGIVITQDSLIENIHFKREWMSPYQLGYKSISVNISDVLASGAEPKYVTIALSLPNDIDNNFIEEFYKGANNALCGAKIVGGDLTGSEKDIAISITAIGQDKGRKISSRSHAKIDYVVITHGEYGSSKAGLEELANPKGEHQKFIKNHLEPQLRKDFANNIATNIKQDYAMMDTSDGLADALFQIAKSSNVTLDINIDKIPHAKEIKNTDWVLFGGEDYNLVACIPEEVLKYIDNYSIIGKVILKEQNCYLKIGNNKYDSFDDLKTFNHWK